MGGGGGGKGGGGGGSQTIGYKYFLGMHICLVHEIDELHAISVGERIAWRGTVSDGSLYIDQPNLFGGEKREGGVSGQVDVLRGGPTQGLNDYLVSRLGPDIPAFRRIVSIVLRQVYLASMNPYIKPWKFLVKKTSSSWYAAKSELGNGDMNPAHIIYACLTNTEWGLGYAPQTIDDTSFRAVADQLYEEDFGLSMIWSAQDPVDDFIADVNRHIDGMLYSHPRTGLWTLKLLRGDYNPETVPVFDASCIREVKSFTRLGYAERTNQLTLKYKEVEVTFGEGSSAENTGEIERSVTVRNPAAKAAQGQVIAETVEYPGITNGGLAARVATRDLRQRSAVLAKVTIEGNRTMTKVLPGDVFKLVWPEYGIDGMFMRVTEIDYGTPQNKVVTIEAIEDYFGIGDAVVSAPTATWWQDPISIPMPSPYRRLTEAPYYVLVRAIIGDIPAIQDAYDPKGGIVTLQAQKPTQDATGYALKALVGSSYVARNVGDWTPTGVLSGAIGPTATSITVNSGSELSMVAANTLAYIEDEVVLVKAVDGNVFTIARGILDTIPAPHAAGVRVWFPDIIEQGYDGTEYLEGESVTIKACTRTTRGELVEEGAPADTITLQARAFRPYPPGNMRLNGAFFPSSISGPLVVTWAHRDRKQQTGGTYIEQGAGDIGPEAGTTYNLKLYDENNVLKRTVTGITGNSYTWDTEASDSGITGSGVQLVATTHLPTTFATDPQITIPATAQVGDLLLLTMCGISSYQFPVIPSGWTTVNSKSVYVNARGYYIGMRVLSRVVQAGDPGSVVQLNYQSSLPNRACMQVYRHASGVVVESSDTDSNSSTTSQTMPIKSTTGTETGHVAVAAACMYLPGHTFPVTTLTPTGFTLDTPATEECNGLAVGHAFVGPGFTMSGDVTTSAPSASNGWVAISLLLKAASGEKPKLWNASVRAELESVRDGYTSWQKWSVSATRP